MKPAESAGAEIGVGAEPATIEAMPGPAAQQLALSQLREHLKTWMHHEPGARLGSDPEELHQLRVAARRVEATLGVFKHQLPPRLSVARRSAKGVLRALGTARDFDVQLADLHKYCEKLPSKERAAAEPLAALLRSERSSAGVRMLAMLDSEATRRWLETLNLASADCTAETAQQAPRAVSVMPERIQARYRKLRKAVRRIDSHSSMDDYHLVRRRAKQLRYALECGSGLFGKPLEEELRALRQLQDALGAHQDADVTKSRLAALAAEGAQLPSETLFLMGRLAEHHLRTTAEARKVLRRAWRRVSGKRWKALRARMLALGEAAAQAQLADAPEPPSPSPSKDALQAAGEPRSLRH